MSNIAEPGFYGFNREQKLMLERDLLANMKTYASDLTEVLEMVSSKAYEDMIYRFYHYSMKVYLDAPHKTRMIVDILHRLAPTGTRLSPLFEEVCLAGLDPIQFDLSHNQAWGLHTRPFIEAFFHARYFLEMAVKYATMLDEPPSLLPSGWAALLCLYEIR